MSKRVVVVGVCAMEKKAQSKPMQVILAKMIEFCGEWLEIKVFPEEVILNSPVEDWPLCDCLISFHANGFPLEKAIAYTKLHPTMHVLNNLQRQYDLLDRTNVYRILGKAGIEHPRHAVLRREGSGANEESLVESHDQIELDGKVFQKPFVEKPVSAEDHNIYMYYPSSSGGGSQRLFRKVANRSSEYSSTSRIRPSGSYIYEEFMPTDGTDVKVYAVGPDYAHAEARKSPALDGKVERFEASADSVERDKDGKEVRYPVILNSREKIIARKVVLAFKQTVCGFDLLRTHGGKSLVCDVNGFSFVKTSTKYYEDTAKILGNMILRAVARRLGIPWKRPYQPDDPPMAPTTVGKMMELRCVLGVIRHGDRTPKQKMKMEVSDPRFFALYERYKTGKGKELKLKRPRQLQEVLDLARQKLKEVQEAAKTGEAPPSSPRERSRRDSETVEETLRKWEQVRGVLEMYGHFAGINRKVQLKYLPSGLDRKSSDSEVPGADNRGPSILLILKWGGELTTAGRHQAECLGRLFRTLYPGIDGAGEDSQGLGFLRLHSTYRHDLKIYASDEGRVQMTAAAFTKGLLALEGELAPIVSQLVKSANTNGLLDDDHDARKFQTEVKKFLHECLQQNRVLGPEDIQRLNPLNSRAIRSALTAMKNPREYCEGIASRLATLVDIVSTRKKKYDGSTLYLNETWELAERRWLKLQRDFRHVRKHTPEVVFDISKIPDIYDNIRYDIQHNPAFIPIQDAYALYAMVKHMADVVVPQEYGIKKAQKHSIAQGICVPLMKKLRVDMARCTALESDEEDENLTRLDPRASQGVSTPMRHVRTRLYFTSESHIHSLLNLIRYGGLLNPDDPQAAHALSFLNSVSEFNYMTQVVLLMYEDTTKASDCPERFHVELLFSPGLFPLFVAPAHHATGNYRSRSLRKASGKSSATEPVPEEDEGDYAYSVVSLGDVIQPIGSSSSSLVQKETINSDMSELAVEVDEAGVRVEVVEAEDVVDVSPAGPVLKSASDLSVPISPPHLPSSPNLALADESQGEAESEDKPRAVERRIRHVSQPRTRSQPIPPVSPRIAGSYGNRHHTSALLPSDHNRLISTAVISGILGGKEQKAEVAEVLSPSLTRGASAPDLKLYDVLDDHARGRLPPLFSLETLHNQLSQKTLDEFFERMVTIRTPLPSPPKTPGTGMSRENSSLSSDNAPLDPSKETLKRLEKKLSSLQP